MKLNPEQEMIAGIIREYVERELIPVAQELDKTETFPKTQLEELSKMGIMGMSIPRVYGGIELDTVSQIIIMEELSRGCASTSVSMGAHVSLCCNPIVNYGTEEQKKKYLPKLASGEWLGAFALTEPNAGSDAVNQQTMAIKDGNDYILNGNKIFITNGGKADIAIIIAVTDRGALHNGISAFIVETATPGFLIGKKEDKLGLRASNTQELIFTDLRIPKENILGTEGLGFKIAMATLDSGRIGIGAQALGIAQAALNASIKYVNEREQFSRPIAKFQAIQFMIADMATKIEAARALVYAAAEQKQNGEDITKIAAQAKLFSSEVAMEVTTKAIQIHGGYGFIKEYNVERFFRNAKITELYEGTSEIMKLIIANQILKLM